jgi:RNA polymerase sigma-70 factor (ECF subfamily)
MKEGRTADPKFWPGVLNRRNKMKELSEGAPRANSPKPKHGYFPFDTDYLGRLAAGDRDTEHHFATYIDQILTGNIHSRLRCAHLREDVKQETFLRIFAVLRRGNGIRVPEALGAFVISVCNNILRETYRAQAKNGEAAPTPQREASNMEAVLIRRENGERLRRVLSSLPERDERVLTLLYLEEHDPDEACQRLKIKRSHLRVLMHRARRRFYAAYSRAGDGCAVDVLRALPQPASH